MYSLGLARALRKLLKKNWYKVNKLSCIGLSDSGIIGSCVIGAQKVVAPCSQSEELVHPSLIKPHFAARGNTVPKVDLTSKPSKLDDLGLRISCPIPCKSWETSGYSDLPKRMRSPDRDYMLLSCWRTSASSRIEMNNVPLLILYQIGDSRYLITVSAKGCVIFCDLCFINENTIPATPRFWSWESIYNSVVSK